LFRKLSEFQQLAAASRLLDDPPSREKLRMLPLNYSYLSHGQKAIRTIFESLGKGLGSTNVLSANALQLLVFVMAQEWGFSCWVHVCQQGAAIF